MPDGDLPLPQAGAVPVPSQGDAAGAAPSVSDVSYPIPPQAIPLAVDQASAASLNPPSAGGFSKEAIEPVMKSESSQVEATGSVQTVEHERSPEIPVEVEAYLQAVEQHQDQLPHEVVIADGSVPQAQSAVPVQKVIVLPITPEEEKKGQFRSPSFSIRWLVEWSHKVMKKFFGRVVYKPTQ